MDPNQAGNEEKEDIFDASTGFSVTEGLYVKGERDTRRLSLVERQSERAASAPHRSSSALITSGAGNTVALLMRVRKAAKAMEKRARVKKSVLAEAQPDLVGETEPSTTNKDYVYVDLSGITSAALAADKEPDLIDIDELITQCLNIDPKSERSKEKTDELVATFLLTYRIFSSAENMIKTLYSHYIKGRDKTQKAVITKSVYQLLLKIIPDLTEQEMTQCSTSIDIWEIRVKHESDQLYQQLRSLVSKTQQQISANKPIDFEQQIVKSKDEVIAMSELKGKDLADQMTLLDSWYYEKMEVIELLIAASTGSLTSKKCPMLRLYWQHMERMKDWFSGFLDIICNQRDKQFEVYLNKLFTVMKTLRKLNNYGTFFMFIAELDKAPLRGDGKNTERVKNVERFWYLMSAYKDLLVSTSDPNSVYKKTMSKLKATSSDNKTSFIPDLNLVFVSMRRYITVDGMMFYNSGINFQKNTNVYKELKEFADLKASFAPYKLDQVRSVLKLICIDPPRATD